MLVLLLKRKSFYIYLIHRPRTFSSKPFGANRASTFSRPSTASVRSRNTALIDSDSDNDMPVGRNSFAPRSSMAPRQSMGRSVVDNDNRRTTMSSMNRFRGY